MTANVTNNQLTKLKEFGAATVHEAQGGIGALDSAIKPLHPAMKLAGLALTVDCKPAGSATGR